MFSQLISKLKSSTMPDKDELGKRLALALVKKMGVIKQPYHFWSSDPKINPPTAHLLWAAILLEDKEAIGQIEGIALWEYSQRPQKNDTDNDGNKNLW